SAGTLAVAAACLSVGGSCFFHEQCSLLVLSLDVWKSNRRGDGDLTKSVGRGSKGRVHGSEQAFDFVHRPLSTSEHLQGLRGTAEHECPQRLATRLDAVSTTADDFVVALTDRCFDRTQLHGGVGEIS